MNHPPTIHAMPVSQSPLLHYGVVVKRFPVEWNSYFKCNQLRFKVRCCYCGRLNKHGMSIDLMNPNHTHGSVLNDSRTCDHCSREFRYLMVL